MSLCKLEDFFFLLLVHLRSEEELEIKESELSGKGNSTAFWLLLFPS